MMKEAARYGRPVPRAALLREAEARGRFLYGLLVGLCSGRALGIIRLVPEGHGLEAWRKLVLEYEPRLATRHCAMLTAVLTPSWSEGAPFLEQLVAWERQVSQYEEASGEQVADSVKCAVITSKAPAMIRQFLQLSPVDYTEDYAQLREALHRYIVRGRHYAGTGAAMIGDAMDIGMVSAAFRSKGKGKGKGTGSSQPEGAGRGSGCWSCGGPHRQSECSRWSGGQQRPGAGQQQIW